MTDKCLGITVGVDRFHPLRVAVIARVYKLRSGPWTCGTFHVPRPMSHVPFREPKRSRSRRFGSRLKNNEQKKTKKATHDYDIDIRNEKRQPKLILWMWGPKFAPRGMTWQGVDLISSTLDFISPSWEMTNSGTMRRALFFSKRLAEFSSGKRVRTDRFSGFFSSPKTDESLSGSVHPGVVNQKMTVIDNIGKAVFCKIAFQIPLGNTPQNWKQAFFQKGRKTVFMNF